MHFAYTTIFVEDVEKSLSFYEKAFGFKVRFLAESKLYGELDTGSTKLSFVSEKMDKDFHLTQNRLNTSSPGFFIGFVDENVETASKKALTHGCINVKGPHVTPWGQTVAHLKDLNGILIEICSPLNY